MDLIFKLFANFPFDNLTDNAQFNFGPYFKSKHEQTFKLFLKFINSTPTFSFNLDQNLKMIFNFLMVNNEKFALVTKTFHAK